MRPKKEKHISGSFLADGQHKTIARVLMFYNAARYMVVDNIAQLT